MNTIKAICVCKELSEDETVIAIRRGPVQDAGCLSWMFHIFLLIITVGGSLPFSIGWICLDYFLSPTYKCQYCGSEIAKENFR